jgi:hypothetical protein
MLSFCRGFPVLLVCLLFAQYARSAEDAIPQSDGLSGRDIYQRVLDNKLDTSYIEHRMISTDPGGSEQTLAFWSRFKDLRSAEKAPDGAVISKTVLKFTSPYDKRDTAYLFIEKKGGADDGYHYSRARTRVSRISPAKESVFGSDFSLDDLAVVRHIDDATYQRLPDEEVQGGRRVVTSRSKPAYAKSRLYVDKDRNVPLRTRHWDEADVEVKQLDIPSEKIRQFAGVWIPMESTMHDLSEKTQSVLYLDRVIENPPLADSLFAPQQLPRLDRSPGLSPSGGLRASEQAEAGPV